MSKFGVLLLAGFLIILLGRALKPGFDSIYDIMNTTFNLTYNYTNEATAWRFMPFLIPAILFGILIAWVTGKIGDRGEG